MSRGFRGFTGEILASNLKMLELAKKGGNDVSLGNQGSYYEFTILFPRE